MQATSPTAHPVTVLVGTGGTIAGRAARADDAVGYTAGALSVAELMAAVPPLAGLPVEAETLAALDSCDMDHATWQRLARRLRALLARPEVGGVVVTHGTDTLEETAYFLHRTVRADKPVVLTAAMRPASALSPDGPQNLWDAVRLARTPGARGVVVVIGGVAWAAGEVRKLHGWRVDAIAGGDGGPLARLDDDGVHRQRDWPAQPDLREEVPDTDPARWPVVEVVTSHAGARGATIDALVDAGAAGIVIAGTGNGSVHGALREAALRAQARGVTVWRASRCIAGGVVGAPEGALPTAGGLTPAQARVALMLRLMAPPVAGQVTSSGWRNE